MLPSDPEQAPGGATPTDAGTTPTDTSAPPPTGLLDVPVTPLVPIAPPPERRRGWAFAASLVLVAILGGGALFMSGYSIGRDAGRAGGGSVDETTAWKPFWDVYDAVTNRFPLAPVDRTKLVEGAIKGLVDSLGDPYSTYLSPDDYKGTLDDISGTFEGIGAEIGAVDDNGNTSDCSTFGAGCHMVVIAPIEGSPAEASGLLAGDVISQIDGASLDGLTADQARDMVRGKAGTTVTLHILRYAIPAGASGAPATPAPASSPKPRELLKELDVTITRAKVQRREVTSRVLANGTVGYVYLSGFSDNGAKETKKALQEFKDKGIKKIVFDLRGNPGGFVVDALNVASQFIASGPVYWTQDAQGAQVETDATGDGVVTDTSIQVVVLIDKGSASASEIVAGALQDRGRAKLIGETSYGKGTVQEWIDLGGLGGVKLTVNKWLTPDKRWIHHVGLTPDVAVTVPADNPPGVDPVLDTALEVLGATAFVPGERLLAA
ncbi:MAG TPA: S41 family peptidase [Candidatus Limnocylindrales bacterium]|nr:S41 family peptidase [Candidatus Limnocylindrales bacterium]